MIEQFLPRFVIRLWAWLRDLVANPIEPAEAEVTQKDLDDAW